MDVSETQLTEKSLLEQISAISGIAETTIQNELGKELSPNPSLDELRGAMLNYLESLHQEYSAEFAAQVADFPENIK
jgi:hypothetical protein